MDNARDTPPSESPPLSDTELHSEERGCDTGEEELNCTLDQDTKKDEGLNALLTTIIFIEFECSSRLRYGVLI